MSSKVLEFFRKEVTCDDAQRRVDAMRRVRFVAYSLGEEGTVNRLLPLLEELIKTSDDEVLYVLAKEYVSLAKHIGREANRTLLILPLTLLANRDESVVRERAVESLKQLVESVSVGTVKTDLVRHYLLPSIESLGVSSWFPPRFSVCALFSVAYPLADEDQCTCLHSLFVKLSNDETPMVKRAAAAAMRDFLPTVYLAKNTLPIELFDSLRRACTDGTQDTLRFMGAQTAARLCTLLPLDQVRQNLFPLLTCAAEDSSWRVRLEVARSLSLLMTLGHEVESSFLLPLVAQLLNDPEAEIRKVTLTAVLSSPILPPDFTPPPNFIEVIGAPNTLETIAKANAFSPQIHSKLEPCPTLTAALTSNFILPHLESLARDFDLSVRVAVARAVGPLSKLVEKDDVQTTLVPLVLELLKEEDQQIRLGLLSSTTSIFNVLGVDSVSTGLLNEVISLSSDPQWRVRVMLVKSLANFGKVFGPEVVTAKLQSVLLAMVQDPVHLVRGAAIESVVPIAELMGTQWVTSIIVPVTNDSSNASSYFQRVVALKMCGTLAEVLPSEKAIDVIVPILKKMLSDPVANVRIVTCEVISEIVMLMQKKKKSSSSSSSKSPSKSKDSDGSALLATLSDALGSSVSKCETDSDEDVRYFASVCKSALSSVV